MSARNVLVTMLVVATACSREQRGPKLDTSSTSASDAAPPSPPPDARSKSSYVGSRYDPLPAGVSYESGTVILGNDGKPSRYVLSHVRTPSGSMLWLDEMLPDEGTTRRRIVRAAIHDPPVAPGERLVIGTCGVDGRFNGDVIAVVKSESGSRQMTVSRAWRANSAAARFDSISTSGVVCEEPGG